MTVPGPVAVTYPRFPPQRASARPTTWWARAWSRAVEEAAYDDADLRGGRRLARAGAVGQVTIAPGEVVAAVEQGDEVVTTTLAVTRLAGTEADAFVELVAAESGRVAALLSGDLPHSLVEHAEESGIELLPYGGELETTCSCAAWTQPCPHALAMLLQVGRLVDRDPLVLLLLRGLPREQLLASLHQRSRVDAPPDDGDPDLDLAYDAAVRAARILDLLDDPNEDVTHLF